MYAVIYTNCCHKLERYFTREKLIICGLTGPVVICGVINPVVIHGVISPVIISEVMSIGYMWSYKSLLYHTGGKVQWSCVELKSPLAICGAVSLFIVSYM